MCWQENRQCFVFWNMQFRWNLYILKFYKLFSATFDSKYLCYFSIIHIYIWSKFNLSSDKDYEKMIKQNEIRIFFFLNKRKYPLNILYISICIVFYMYKKYLIKSSAIIYIYLYHYNNDNKFSFLWFGCFYFFILE